MALEARCHDIYFTRCLRAGDARSDVEQTWAEAKTASARLGLAVELSPDNLSPWLAKAGHRNAALGICSSAVHKGLKGDPHMAIKQVERTLKDLESYRGH
jgi:hypothetical protein